MPEAKEPTVIKWNRFLELARESEELPVSTLIDMLFNLNLPLPVLDETNKNRKIGEVVYAELVEQNNGIHVIMGGVLETEPK